MQHGFEDSLNPTPYLSYDTGSASRSGIGKFDGVLTRQVESQFN
jgi:hypothetical protein